MIKLNVVSGDTFCLLLNLFIYNLLEVDSYQCNRGHQGYSIILPSIFLLFYCIYMHDI
jgi:hypothetical protein